MVKKLGIGVLVAAMIGTLVVVKAESQGSTASGDNGTNYYHYYGCYCPNMKQQLANTPPQRIEKFKEENKSTIDRIIKLRAEIRSLACTQNPDWNRVIEKQKEISELRFELEKKAISSGLPPFVVGHILSPGYGHKFNKGHKGACRLEMEMGAACSCCCG